jgi:HK97 gp10 family phage protein
MAEDLARIDRLAAELHQTVEAAIYEALVSVVDAAKARVPVDTGALQNAIHIDIQPEGIYVVAGDSKAWYGHLVEHGSVNQPARPFLIPAFEEHRASIVATVAAAIGKVA